MLEGTVIFKGKQKGLDIVIRHLSREDVDLLLSFINTISKEQTFIMYQGRQLSLEGEEKYVNDFVDKAEMGHAVKLLVFHESTLIGVADVLRSAFETEPHIGLFGITIVKEWRGKGIGSFLMDKTLEESKRYISGLKIIRLGVFANNPVAENMYKKKGFIRYGNLPKGLLHRGEYVDHLLMYKIIST